MNFLMVILSISFLILIHEFGHFLAAKLLKIRVKEFALGFGPPLLSFKTKETRYRLNLLLFGGYVRFFEEKGQEKEKTLFPVDEVEAKPFFQKFLLLISGVEANFILGLLVLIVLSFSFGLPQSFAKLDQVFSNSPAAKAGFKKGDLITALNGKPIKNGNQFVETIQKSTGQTLSLEIKRGKQIKFLRVRPKYDSKKKKGVIGVKFALEVEFQRKGVFSSLKWAFQKFGEVFYLTFFFLGKFISGKISLGLLAGPVGVVHLGTKVAETGLYSFLFLQALISINLGVLNILPIPPLDGGRLFIYFLEALRRKPLGLKVKNALIGAGLFILLSLIALVTLNDIIRLIGGSGFPQPP